MVGSLEVQGWEPIGGIAGASGAAGLSAASAKCADSGRDDRVWGAKCADFGRDDRVLWAEGLDSGRDERFSVRLAGGLMPTVISKMGPERVRSRTVPRTSPIRETISPG